MSFIFIKRNNVVTFLIASALLLSTVSLPARAGSTWTQKALGTTQSLRALTVIDSTYVAVGNTGKTVRSTDGLSWSIVSTNSDQWLHDIFVHPNGTLVAVGESGIAVESSDNGLSWTQLSVPSSESFYAGAAGNTTAYMVGTGGVILFFDSNTWLAPVSPTTEDINGVFSLDDDKTAWAVADGGVLLYTTQGGNNWTKFGTISTENLRDIYFTSTTTGYVVGINGTLLKTTNSGTSWSTITVAGLDRQDLESIVVSGNNIIAVGKKIIVQSNDGGSTWTSQSFASDYIDFYDVTMDSGGTFSAVGTKFDASSVVYSYEITEPEPEAVEETEQEPEPKPESTPTDFGEATAGDLIKMICPDSALADHPCKAVYFLSEDGKRHAFPNEKVFFTWYLGFQNVVDVSAEFLSARPLGKNVTYHPGKRMVKFQSVPTVYAVEKGGVLRAISSEQVAEDLYGATWNQQIDDISDSFFGNYTFGSDVTSSDLYDRLAQEASVTGLGENF
jgi:photosystem II stability/assembly factor-like uncharacterized protein